MEQARQELDEFEEQIDNVVSVHPSLSDEAEGINDESVVNLVESPSTTPERAH